MHFSILSRYGFFSDRSPRTARPPPLPHNTSSSKFEGALPPSFPMARNTLAPPPWPEVDDDCKLWYRRIDQKCVNGPEPRKHSRDTLQTRGAPFCFFTSSLYSFYITTHTHTHTQTWSPLWNATQTATKHKPTHHPFLWWWSLYIYVYMYCMFPTKSSLFF